MGFFSSFPLKMVQLVKHTISHHAQHRLCQRDSSPKSSHCDKGLAPFSLHHPLTPGAPQLVKGLSCGVNIWYESELSNYCLSQLKGHRSLCYRGQDANVYVSGVVRIKQIINHDPSHAHARQIRKLRKIGFSCKDIFIRSENC